VNKGIKTLIVCMLLIVSFLQFSNVVFAGDENDPEITDEENDLFGAWAKPDMDPDEYSYLDIVSAWFSEKSDEPDYLFLYLKVRDFRFETLRAIYAIHWDYKDIWYGAGVHTHTSGTYQAFIVGNIDENNYYSINGEFDVENNIVIFKVPKVLVGYPEKDDVLTQTDAWNALRNRIELLSLVFGDGELIKDWAGYGRDYTVQYESLGVPYMHRLFGGAVLKAGYEFPYNFEATDPQGEDVFFYVDWGDDTITEWDGPHPSDEPIQLSHSWSEHGSYTIKAKARDINGYESEEAEFGVSIIKPRVYPTLFERCLTRYPLIMSLFKLFANRFL
jgi:hypothetical protein